MSELIRYEVRDRVAILTVDNPPVNALGPGVVEGIEEAIARANADAGVDAMVLIGHGSTFIAGADIKIFGTIKTREQSLARSEAMHARLKRIEDATKPLVAAIHGNALGGGLEVAMSCHYRVMAPDAKVGQPEVLLGIIPGAGGTQRLPRLCEAALAIEMCTAGKPVPAAKALAAGIVDHVVSGNLLDGAIEFARAKAAAHEIRKTRDLPAKTDRSGRCCGMRGGAKDARGNREGLTGALQGRRCDRGGVHARLRRGLGARARALRRLRDVHRMPRAGPHVLRGSRSREGARRAEGHAGRCRSRARP